MRGSLAYRQIIDLGPGTSAARSASANSSRDILVSSPAVRLVASSDRRWSRVPRFRVPTLDVGAWVRLSEDDHASLQPARAPSSATRRQTLDQVGPEVLPLDARTGPAWSEATLRSPPTRPARANPEKMPPRPPVTSRFDCSPLGMTVE